MTRPTPFALVFESIASDRWPTISAALAKRGADPRDRDAFLMTREVVDLVRELRPDEGIGEGIDQLVALVHHAYLFWAEGEALLAVPPGQLTALLAGMAPESADRPAVRRAYYIQIPERRVWAESVPGQPHEPLDGCFVHGVREVELRVLGVFGVRPDRLGFTVVEASGPRPERLARADGTPLFASVLPGGEAAGLFSLVDEEELLELGWRSRVAGEPAETN